LLVVNQQKEHIKRQEQCIYAHAAQSLTQGQRRAAQAQMLPMAATKKIKTISKYINTK
jgi:hemerythrin-like domain-containing protein